MRRTSFAQDFCAGIRHSRFRNLLALKT